MGLGGHSLRHELNIGYIWCFCLVPGANSFAHSGTLRRTKSLVCTETNFSQIADVCDGTSQLRLCGGTAVSCRFSIFLMSEPNLRTRDRLSLAALVETTTQPAAQIDNCISLPVQIEWRGHGLAGHVGADHTLVPS